MLGEQNNAGRDIHSITVKHAEVHRELDGRISSASMELASRLDKLEVELRRSDEELARDCTDRIEGLERNQSNASKETSKRMNALDLRISGLQGSTAECRRDLNKMR